MGTYHRMLQRAKYAQSRKHVAHLRETQRFGLMEIEGSDRMPMGRVSVTIYDNVSLLEVGITGPSGQLLCLTDVHTMTCW